jgi:hypothetical protein
MFIRHAVKAGDASVKEQKFARNDTAAIPGG